MAEIMKMVDFTVQNRTEILSLLLEHIRLTALAVALAVAIGVPIGILVNYKKGLSKPILGAANIIQAVPSMALLGLAIPLLGIGTKPAVVLVILYSLLPIIKNTYTGLENIDAQLLEAAEGIGLTKFQILRKVQIPLALPVIMAGVRISAVTAVGLMTMAAFIGGGGLGFLVFSGIRTVNNYKILAGAVPACILALSVDFILGQVEKLVTPVSLQTAGSDKETVIRRRFMQKRILAVTAAGLVVLFGFNFAQGLKAPKETIVVGGKDFTEQEILCHMVSDAIEERLGVAVDRRPALGGTQVCFSALKSNEIDLYVDYTGTCYGDTLGYPPIPDVQEVYDTAKKDFKEKFGIEMLRQMGFNNTYTLAVTRETAERYNLSKISDLAPVAGELRAITSLEFLNRGDGLPGVEKKYGFTFADETGIDGSPRYTALMNDEGDVVDAFSTDGLLKKFDLAVLEDDKQFFPPYYAVPVARGAVLEKYPELTDILGEVGDLLNDEVMRELNYKVDEEGQDPAQVAQEFLEANGF